MKAEKSRSDVSDLNKRDVLSVIGPTVCCGVFMS